MYGYGMGDIGHESRGSDGAEYDEDSGSEESIDATVSTPTPSVSTAADDDEPNPEDYGLACGWDITANNRPARQGSRYAFPPRGVLPDPTLHQRRAEIRADNLYAKFLTVGASLGMALASYLI